MLEVEGELDLSSKERLGAPLDAAIDMGERRILVDLGQCSFIDSKGLELLVRSAARIVDDGGRFGVLMGSDQIRRVFDVTALDRALAVYEDHDQAIAELAG